jgi:hypothetical protein
MSHIERMKTELKDLTVKTDALLAFIQGNPICRTLPETDQALMSEQWEAMSWYRTTLTQRIERAEAAA